MCSFPCGITNVVFRFKTWRSKIKEIPNPTLRIYTDLLRKLSIPLPLHVHVRCTVQMDLFTVKNAALKQEKSHKNKITEISF